MHVQTSHKTPCLWNSDRKTLIWWLKFTKASLLHLPIFQLLQIVTFAVRLIRVWLAHIYIYIYVFCKIDWQKERLNPQICTAIVSGVKYRQISREKYSTDFHQGYRTRSQFPKSLSVLWASFTTTTLPNFITSADAKFYFKEILNSLVTNWLLNN